MVNSFLFVIHHIQRQIMKKKCVKAVTSMFIKVCQGHHKHYDKKVKLLLYDFYIFLAFKKIDKQHGGGVKIFERFFSEPEGSMIIMMIIFSV